MTDLNKQELRRLAHEASETECLWLDRSWLASIMAEDWADYLVALEPVVVIALLDELAQAKCEAGHAIQQKDAAYSECKALRQDAERYRWLRGQEAEHGVSVVSISQWLQPAVCVAVTFVDGSFVDVAIDREMAKAAAPQNQNTGHGHVFPRPDGNRARCGGPGLCRECAADAVRKEAARHE